MRFLLLPLLFLSVPALAQPAMPTPAATTPDSPATIEFRQEMDRMHQGMMLPFTNDTDRDFVQGMIPHHQAAIDMAKTELRYGKDPAIKRMAHDIIEAQQREIVTMRNWLAAHKLGK